MPIPGARYRFVKKEGKTMRFAFKGSKVVETVEFVKRGGKLVKK